ncbi:MAG: alpha/beta hydrolase [Pseudomonadota bacterium]
MRALRWLGLGLGGLVAAALLIVLGLAALAEWQRYRAPPRTAPLTFEVLPSGASASASASASAPVLILLHGAGLNGHMWDAVRRHLDPRWRVIALDLPNHGSRRDEVFTLYAAVATVAEAARSVAPAPVLLVGDSLGGYTAMAAASALPREQLRGLVLAGSSGQRGIGQVFGYLQGLVFTRILSLRFSESEFAARALPIFGVSEADRPAITAAGVNTSAVPTAVRGLLFFDFRSALAAVEQPVLIVNGDLDRGAIEGEAALVAAARQATTYRFENTGHGVSMRRSAEFAAVVNDFAARTLLAPSSKP